MLMARVVITAVVLEGRSKSVVARDYGVSRRWVQVLAARYLAEGEAAFEPRSRRPHASPQRTSQAVEDAIVALRKSLAGAGLDAGSETIAWHLCQQAGCSPSVATIWRILSRRGFVTPQPHKRPARPGSDGNNDTTPSAVPGGDFPVHALAIAALGVHLIDYLDFSDLVPVC